MEAQRSARVRVFFVEAQDRPSRLSLRAEGVACLFGGQAVRMLR